MKVCSEIQAALDTWVAERAGPEKVTGVAAYISFGDPGPAIEAFAGKVGADPRDPPVRQNTLFQMGSTSKSFAVAVILKLEAAGALSLDDTIGKWLPQYPAWKDWSLQHLLNMTTRIPTYSETETLSRIWVSEPSRELTAAELVHAAYPTGTHDLPPPKDKWFYSNTNYILAGMIAAKAAGQPYRHLVHEMVIDAFELDSTFYEDGAYPASVMKRLAHGYWNNPDCAGYQPNCKVSWNAPMLGRDVRDMSLSWAQAAGGAIASARDVDRWMRAVFEGRVVPPKQQAEWMALVSQTTGRPITDVSPDDKGYSLGLAKGIFGPLGAVWYYKGMSLGYRTLYGWFEKENLMITLQTNSQPSQKNAEETDQLNVLLQRIHPIVKSHAK